MINGPVMLLHKLKNNLLFNNLSWMFVAEGLARLSRLVTLFVLASLFSNEQYGLAMLALVCHELFRVFTRLGTGAKIIQCDTASLTAILANAASMQWCIAILVCLLQILSAPWIAAYYDQPLLSDLLGLMALSHLLYPLVAIRIFESQRRSELKFYGIASGLCIAAENLFVAALVWCQAGLMAVAYSKLAAALLWVAFFWSLPSTAAGLRVDFATQKTLINFAGKTLVSELGRSLRYQADSLIAARLLTPDMFGIYSFAKSAAQGIAQSVSSAYLAALYPFLCKRLRAGQNRPAFRQAGLGSLIIATGFLLQALLAPHYIQWLFPERWNEALLLASALCLSAIPMLLVDHVCVLARAEGKPGLELRHILISNTFLCTALLTFANASAMTIALTVLSANVLAAIYSGISHRLSRTRSHAHKPPLTASHT